MQTYKLSFLAVRCKLKLSLLAVWGKIKLLLGKVYIVFGLKERFVEYYGVTRQGSPPHNFSVQSCLVNS